MKTIALVVGVLISPLTQPAWFLERLIRRRRPDFEFSSINSTPYFVVWVIASTALIVWAQSTLWLWIGAYFLSAIELVALGVSLMLGVGRPGRIQAFMRQIARRRRPPGPIEVSGASVYAALVAVGYSAWYFGCLALFLYRAFDGFYHGVEARGSLGDLWQFLYYSMSTITTLGGKIQPSRFPSEFLTLLEVLIGLFYFIFLLSALISRYLDETP